MKTLDQAIRRPNAFPAGLFWLYRAEEALADRVTTLLVEAVRVGIDAWPVPVMNFDETMRDLVRQADGVENAKLDKFATRSRPWTSPPRPVKTGRWPVVRLNALPLLEVPTVCRRISCSIGGTAEVREAVGAAGVDVIAVRSQRGVLAFGTDVDVRTAFGPYGIKDFDLHTFIPPRQRYESTERGLLRSGLTRAIAQRYNLRIWSRHGYDLLAPADPADQTWAPLKGIVGSLVGTLGDDPELTWQEGMAVRLGWADDRLWLLVEPRMVFNNVAPENRAARADFARERMAQRYNRALNTLISFWTDLVGASEELHALGIEDGVDAVYRISSLTAFSWRTDA